MRIQRSCFALFGPRRFGPPAWGFGLALGFFCTAVGRVGLALASVLPPTPMILGSYVVLNLGQGMSSTLLKTLMSAHAGVGRRGLQLGLLTTCEKVAGIVGPLAAGPLYASPFGPAAPACAAALVAAVGGCVTFASASQLRAVSEASHRLSQEKKDT